MVKTDFYKKRKDGVNLYRSYSDRDMMIRQDQTGNEYAEAIDVENSGYTYTETENPIPLPDERRIARIEERQNAAEQDIEANAEAIEELASIVAGGDEND